MASGIQEGDGKLNDLPRKDVVSMATDVLAPPWRRRVSTRRAGIGVGVFLVPSGLVQALEFRRLGRVSAVASEGSLISASFSSHARLLVLIRRTHASEYW
jgi:hypothetical protein